jgi:hypothetical protein
MSQIGRGGLLPPQRREHGFASKQGMNTRCCVKAWHPRPNFRGGSVSSYN